MKKIIVIVMLLAGVCLGSQITCNSDTGLTVYSVLYRDKSGGGFEVYHPTDEEWVASTAITYADMNIPMTEDVNLLGAYYATLPDTNVSAGRYYVRTYSRIGAAPANTDTVIGYDVYNFDGSNEVLVGDNIQWLGTACATPTVAGVPEVDMTHINGGATNGYNATLKLKMIDVNNPDAGGDALKLYAARYALSATGVNTGIYTTGSTNGIYCNGTYGLNLNGSSIGLQTVGGSYGLSAFSETGIGFTADSTSGYGFGVTGATAGDVQANITGSIGSLATQAKADVQAEVEAADLSSSTVGTVNALGTQAKLDVNAEADTAISDAALATATELAATDANVTLILADTTEMQGKLPTGTISDFNATDDTIAHVTLVDTTTTNTDMLTADDIWDEADITAGGTSTAREILKRLYAWSCGKWIDKAGTASATQQILDAEDASTVIIELTSDKKTPYKTTTIVE